MEHCAHWEDPVSMENFHTHSNDAHALPLLSLLPALISVLVFSVCSSMLGNFLLLYILYYFNTLKSGSQISTFLGHVSNLWTIHLLDSVPLRPLPAVLSRSFSSFIISLYFSISSFCLSLIFSCLYQVI